MKITILGCGASGGVPIIGCECARCTGAAFGNSRLRSSILVSSEKSKILVDAGPDLRQQCLAYKLREVDGIIITHNHADHVGGLDDVRAFNYAKQGAIPIYTDHETMEWLRVRSDYAFVAPQPNITSWYKPYFAAHEIKADFSANVCGDISFNCFWQGHGKINSLGIRFGDAAYSTDVDRLSDEAIDYLSGIKCWIIDCISFKPNPTHANLELALKWIERVKPEKAILTHMSHEIDYEEIKARLPANVIPAYDGMIIEL